MVERRRVSARHGQRGGAGDGLVGLGVPGARGGLGWMRGPLLAAALLGCAGALAAPAPASGPTSQNAELFYQIQTLQQEVAQLRGLVEELTHQVNRLAADQQNQYRDLDGRIVALRSGAAPAAVAPAGPAAPGGAAAGAPAVVPAPGAAAGQAATATPAAAGDREAYSAAFELMRARKFPEATAAFNRFVRDYPNSEFTANSFYWLGELYLAQDNLEQARQSFTQVLNLYPDSQKVPDALYKLGVVQHRLGDVARAREFLNRAVSQYPGSSAAALAQTYLSELQ